MDSKRSYGAESILELARQRDAEFARIKVAEVEQEAKYDGCLWEFMAIGLGDHEAMVRFFERWGENPQFIVFHILENLFEEKKLTPDTELPEDTYARWERIMSETDELKRSQWLSMESKIAAHKIRGVYLWTFSSQSQR